MEIFLIGFVSFIVGALIGVAFLQHEEKWFKKVKKVLIWCAWISFFAFILYAIHRNQDTLKILGDKQHPVSSALDLLKIFLKVPFNLQVISISVFLVLSGVFSILIRIPFSNWESIKIFGLETKRVVEKAEEVITNQLSEERKIAETRANVMYSFLTTAGLNGGRQHLNQSIELAIRYLQSIYYVTTHDYIQAQMQYGVILLPSGHYHDAMLKSIDDRKIRQYISNAYKNSKYEPWTEENHSMLCGLFTLEGTAHKYIVYFYSHNYVFSNSDVYTIKIMESTLNLLIKNPQIGV